MIRAEMSLGQLYDAGVRLDPALAFTLAAAMLDPRWNASERFTIAHTEHPGSTAVYLHVPHAGRATVGDSPPLWDVAATIVCPADRLLEVLAGRRPDELEVAGDGIALSTLLGQLDHAQYR
jgi:hypothetical protein